MSEESLAYQILTEGGSGQGISTYKTIYFCPRKHRLNEEAKELRGGTYELPPEETYDKKGNRKPSALALGSILHWLFRVQAEKEMADAAE